MNGFELLEVIESAIGREAFDPHRRTWQRRVANDADCAAMVRALELLRSRMAKAGKEPLRSPAAWLTQTWLSLRSEAQRERTAA